MSDYLHKTSILTIGDLKQKKMFTHGKSGLKIAKLKFVEPFEYHLQKIRWGNRSFGHMFTYNAPNCRKAI